MGIGVVLSMGHAYVPTKASPTLCPLMSSPKFVSHMTIFLYCVSAWCCDAVLQLVVVNF